MYVRMKTFIDMHMFANINYVRKIKSSENQYVQVTVTIIFFFMKKRLFFFSFLVVRKLKLYVTIEITNNIESRE